MEILRRGAEHAILVLALVILAAYMLLAPNLSRGIRELLLGAGLIVAGAALIVELARLRVARKR